MSERQHLGSVTAAQMAEIDRTLEQRIGIPLASSIERTALHTSTYLRSRFLHDGARHILLLVGGGHNGADVLAIGRQLASWGHDVIALLDQIRETLKPATEQQLALAEQFGVRLFEPGALLPEADLVLDGLVGYGLEGSILNDHARELIQASASYQVPHIAIDLPTGMDASTGRATTPAFRADLTLVVGYPKTGLMKPYAPALTGELVVIDAGIPHRWWSRLGQPAPDFSRESTITIEPPSPRAGTIHA